MKRALVALALGGCLEVPPPSCPEHGDFDQDGWECFGNTGDCDDGDATRNPGMVEVCGDGIDQDCTGGDAACPQLEGVSITGAPDSNLWQVSTPTTQVQLDGPEWLVSSLRLRGDGEELLYTGPNPEQLLSLAVYPLFHRQDTLDVVPTLGAAGPARVEVLVTWQDDVYGSGTTTLAFTPDGRIARHERMHSVGYTNAGPTLYFATFASFDSRVFTHLDWTSNVDPPVVLGTLFAGAPYQATQSDVGWVCLAEEDTGRRIAMAWQPIDGAQGARATLGPDDPPAIAFEYDWERAATAIDEGDVESITLLAPSMLDTPVTEPCAELDPAAIVAPAPLLFTTGAPGAADTDGDGYLPGEGLYEIANTGGDDHVALEIGVGALDGGVTLRVVMDTPSGVTVWRGFERLLAGTDYLIQPSTGGPGVLIYFPPGELTAGDTLWIAQPGGEP